MIPYIGDISKNDAFVLQEYASSADSILEFGCGASTQVMASSVVVDATGIVPVIISIDTEPSWIEKTKENLKILGVNKEVHFYDYRDFIDHILIDKPFDFIFVDGVDSLRREFAIKIWPFLQVGGVMAFHDTRRGHDFRNVLEVLATFQDEIGEVKFNTLQSNITVIRKKPAAPYDNWQISEKKKPWQLGYGDPPQEFIDSLKKE